MTTNALVPLLSAIVSLVFAIFLFDQFLHRRRPYQLVWALGFLWYAISSSAGFLGNLDGWGGAEYRWYYFFGGMAVPAYLGMGTVYLLAPRRIAHALFAVLLLGSLFAIFRVFTVPLEANMLPAAAGAGEPGRGIFPASVRVLAPLFAVPGATALILGALWSAWVFWRKQAQPYRVTSNVLIALGAFFPSITGTMRFFDLTPPFMLGELLGVSVIFIGFLVSIEVFEQFRIPFTRVTLGARRSPV